MAIRLPSRQADFSLAWKKGAPPAHASCALSEIF
jgi:hypothetical protein